MKNLFLFPLIFLTFYACQESVKTTKYEAIQTNELKEVTSKFDQQKELESILTILDGETKCFLERNYDCWKTHWSQEEYACLTYNNEDGSYRTELGWNKINTFIGTIIKNRPIKKGGPTYPMVTRKHIEVKFFGAKAAYLAWEQNQIDGEYMVGSQETRVMEKVNGQWKIVNSSTFWDYSNMYPITKNLNNTKKPTSPIYEL